jgi:hypothetical protein
MTCMVNHEDHAASVGAALAHPLRKVLKLELLELPRSRLPQ